MFSEVSVSHSVHGGGGLPTEGIWEGQPNPKLPYLTSSGGHCSNGTHPTGMHSCFVVNFGHEVN